MNLIRLWRRYFLITEFWTAVVITLAFSLWIEWSGSDHVIEKVLKDNRGAVYGTIASILGALLGFVITTLALILTLSSHERLTLLTESPHYQTLWDVFTSTIRWLAIATAVVLLALMVDRESRPVPWIQYAAFGSLTLAMFRLGITLWFLEHVVRLITKPSKARSADEP